MPSAPGPMKLPRLIRVIACALAVSGCASMWTALYQVDAHIASTPATVVWGYLPAGRPPVLTIRSGQTVKIDTISHQGLLSGTDPVKFFGAAGNAPGQGLPDASGVFSKTPRPKTP